MLTLSGLKFGTQFLRRLAECLRRLVTDKWVLLLCRQSTRYGFKFRFQILIRFALAENYLRPVAVVFLGSLIRQPQLFLVLLQHIKNLVATGR